MQYVFFFGTHLFTSRPQELVGDAVCRNSPKKTTNGVAHTRRCDPPSVKLKNETNNVKFGKKQFVGLMEISPQHLMAVFSPKSLLCPSCLTPPKNTLQMVFPYLHTWLWLL